MSAATVWAGARWPGQGGAVPEVTSGHLGTEALEFAVWTEQQARVARPRRDERATGCGSADSWGLDSISCVPCAALWGPGWLGRQLGLPGAAGWAVMCRKEAPALAGEHWGSGADAIVPLCWVADLSADKSTVFSTVTDGPSLLVYSAEHGCIVPGTGRKGVIVPRSLPAGVCLLCPRLLSHCSPSGAGCD